jgi:hypothetical protein
VAIVVVVAGGVVVEVVGGRVVVVVEIVVVAARVVVVVGRCFLAVLQAAVRTPTAAIPTHPRLSTPGPRQLVGVPLSRPHLRPAI